MVTIALSVGVPFMLGFVERGVRRKPAPAPLPVAAGETMPAATVRYER
jgi:hypothetical protein